MAQTARRFSPSISAEEARAIAKEAYIYGFPMVDSYRIQHAYFIDRKNPEYKGGWNKVHNTARVYTPEDTAIQTPNSDTPYSFIGADLRAEPLVISVPKIEKERFYHAQFIDMYTFNFAYVGTRTTGNGAGSYLLIGPRWRGERPEGMQVIRCETDFAFILIRTQLFGPDDIDNVKRIQAGYKVQPMSKFLGEPPAPAAPKIRFMKPITVDQERISPEFFDILNFILQFCPTHPSERELMARFARLGIAPGRHFDAQKYSPDLHRAIHDGMADAWKLGADLHKLMDQGKLTSADLFGTRQYLQSNHLYRMMGAVLGIYGNSKEEAWYPSYTVDAEGRSPNGANRYELRFAADGLPPVEAFWSLTLYQMPESLLYANSFNRYLINSPMLPGLKRDTDGGLTLYIQHASPGPEKESNWLPAPNGPFVCAMRLYAPKPEALDGSWTKPALRKVG